MAYLCFFVVFKCSMAACQASLSRLARSLPLLIYLLLLTTTLALATRAPARLRNPCSEPNRPCNIVLRGRAGVVGCYNPATHTCSANMICQFGEVRCGNGCVNRANSICHFEEFACPYSAPSLCGAACFNAERYGCESGELVPRSVMATKSHLYQHNMLELNRKVHIFF